MNTSARAACGGLWHRTGIESSQWYDLIKTAQEGGQISTDHGGKITHVQDIADALTYAIGDQSVAGAVL